MSDLLEIGVTIDSAPVTKSMDDVEKAFAKAVATIKRETKLLEQAEKASADVRAAAQITASDKVAAKELANTTKVLAQKIALREKSKSAEEKAIKDVQRAEAAAEAARKKEFSDWAARQRQKVAMMRESERMDSFSALMNESQDAARRFGVVTQQAGYQMGDFIVQIQSGTNAFVAFGQQATQMVGFLPYVANELRLTAAAANAWMLGLSIVIPLATALGAALMRTGEDAKKSTGGVDSYTKAIQALNEELQKNNELVLLQKYDTTSSTMANAAKEIDIINEKLPVLRKELDAMNMAVAQAGGIDIYTLIFGDGADILQKQYDLLVATKAELLQSMRIAEGITAAEDASKLQAIAKLQKLEEQRNVYLDLIASAESVKTLMGEITNSSPPNGWLSAAISEMSDLANEAAKAAGFVALALTQAPLAPLGAGPAGMGSSPPTGGAVGTSIRPGRRSVDFGYTPPKGGGGGSRKGGGSSGAASIISELMSQQEEVDKWYKTSQSALQAASDAELAIIGGKQEAIERLEKEHQDRLLEIRQARQQQQISDMGGFFGALAGVAEAGGKKMVKVVAAAQAIEGTINAYGAAIKALNTPGITLAGRMAAYLSVLGAGLQGVAAIKSAGGIGGGGGGSVGTSSGAVQTTPQQVMLQGLRPDDLFSGQFISDLFDKVYKENGNRGTVFMVAK